MQRAVDVLNGHRSGILRLLYESREHGLIWHREPDAIMRNTSDGRLKNRIENGCLQFDLHPTRQPDLLLCHTHSQPAA